MLTLPRDLANIETPPEQREKYLKNNLKSNIRQLLSSGLSADELTEFIQQNIPKESTSQ